MAEDSESEAFDVYNLQICSASMVPSQCPKNMARLADRNHSILHVIQTYIIAVDGYLNDF